MSHQKNYTLEFARWLQDNFDELMSQDDKQELIIQAHKDAAVEKALGTPEKRKHKVFKKVAKA